MAATHKRVGLFVRLLDLTCGFSMGCLFRYWLLGGHLHAARAAAPSNSTATTQREEECRRTESGSR